MPRDDAIGRRAETAACHCLEAQGLRLVTRNFRGPRGEIDLVMRDGATLVFVEVRYRRPSRFGGGAESVGRHKQARIIATALYYLQSHHQTALPAVRFDVVALAPRGEGLHIDWLRDAFQAT